MATVFVFLVAQELMKGEPSWLAMVFGVSVATAVWSSIDGIQVRRRVTALTTVLEETGALDAYIDRAMPTATHEAAAQE
jgi:hypothetical protein